MSTRQRTRGRGRTRVVPIVDLWLNGLEVVVFRVANVQPHSSVIPLLPIPPSALTLQQHQMPPIRLSIPGLPSRRRISQPDLHFFERPFPWQKPPYLASGPRNGRHATVASSAHKKEQDADLDEDEDNIGCESEDPTELGLPNLPEYA